MTHITNCKQNQNNDTKIMKIFLFKAKKLLKTKYYEFWKASKVHISLSSILKKHKIPNLDICRKFGENEIEKFDGKLFCVIAYIWHLKSTHRWFFNYSFEMQMNGKCIQTWKRTRFYSHRVKTIALNMRKKTILIWGKMPPCHS